jgi:hypothetical protein
MNVPQQYLSLHENIWMIERNITKWLNTEIPMQVEESSDPVTDATSEV